MQESRKSNTPVIVMIGDKRIGRIRQYTVKCTRPLEDICTAGDPWPAARLPQTRSYQIILNRVILEDFAPTDLMNMQNFVLKISRAGQTFSFTDCNWISFVETADASESVLQKVTLCAADRRVADE